MDKYPITVDSVIFGYAKGDLKVALIERKNPPFKGMWAIPGGFIEGNETIEKAALRELKEETGVDNVILEQFQAFNTPGRDPRGPVTTIALFALINLEQNPLVASDDAANAQWWPAYNLPPLAFDHAEIYVKAIEALRISIRTKPIAFDVLPKEFTLDHLQDLFEQVFNSKFDAISFQEYISSIKSICLIDRNVGGSKPSALYRFDPKKTITTLPSLSF